MWERPARWSYNFSGRCQTHSEVLPLGMMVMLPTSAVRAVMVTAELKQTLRNDPLLTRRPVLLCGGNDAGRTCPPDDAL